MNSLKLKCIHQHCFKKCINVTDPIDHVNVRIKILEKRLAIENGSTVSCCDLIENYMFLEPTDEHKKRVEELIEIVINNKSNSRYTFLLGEKIYKMGYKKTAFRILIVAKELYQKEHNLKQLNLCNNLLHKIIYEKELLIKD